MKRTLLIITIFFILTGCSNEINNSYSKQESTIVEDNKTTENINVPIETEKSKTDSSIYVEDNIQYNKVENDQNKDTIQKSIDNEYTSNDMTTIKEFNNIDENINTLLKSDSSEKIKDQVKGTFISIVDFIFYNGSINGVTFDQLSNAGKEKVLKIANDIDLKIKAKYPDYKETISDKTKKAFLKASEIIQVGAHNIKDFSKEKLGEDNYNTLIDSKDDLIYYTKNAFSIVGKIGNSLLNQSKNYLKNWYEKFKNN